MKIISELSRSVLVGIIGTIFNLFLLYVFEHFLFNHYLLGATLANIITMIYIFVADRYYTFKHGNGSLHVQFTKYLLIYILSNLSSVALLAFFVEIFGWHYLLAQAIATTLVSFVTFIIFKYWIFHCYDWR